MYRILLIPLLLFVSCGITGGNQNGADIPGKIAFAADDEHGTSQIFTMNADGSNVRQVTNLSDQFSAMSPAWSPDGRQIVYAQLGHTTLGAELYVMDADGGNRRPLKKRAENRLGGITSVVGTFPAWSPDGSKIAYQVCSNCEIGGGDWQIVTVETAGEIFDQNQFKSIASHPASDEHPAWSPKDNRIVFVSNRNIPPTKEGTDIYLLDLRNNEITRLTETGNAGRPIWGQDGQSIYYWAHNNLFKLDLSNFQSTQISFELRNEFRFRPLDISKDSNKILLLVFNLENPGSEQSLQILDLDDKSLTTITVKNLFMGADWY